MVECGPSTVVGPPITRRRCPKIILCYIFLLLFCLFETPIRVRAATPYLGIRVVNAGERFRYTFDTDVLGDPDADTYTYGMGALVNAEWLTFDASTLVLSGTPEKIDLGLLSISIFAYDGPNVVHTARLDVKVNSLPTYNGDPLITVVTAAEGNFTYAIEVGTFDDADGDTQLFVAEIKNCPESVCFGELLPPWLTFFEEKQVFEGRPTADDRGVYEITLTATDTVGFSVSALVTIRLDNDAPELLQGYEVFPTQAPVVSTWYSFNLSTVLSNTENDRWNITLASSAPSWLSVVEVNTTYGNDSTAEPRHDYFLEGLPILFDGGDFSTTIWINDGWDSVAYDMSFSVQWIFFFIMTYGGAALFFIILIVMFWLVKRTAIHNFESALNADLHEVDRFEDQAFVVIRRARFEQERKKSGSKSARSMLTARKSSRRGTANLMGVQDDDDLVFEEKDVYLGAAALQNLIDDASYAKIPDYFRKARRWFNSDQGVGKSLLEYMSPWNYIMQLMHTVESGLESNYRGIGLVACAETMQYFIEFLLMVQTSRGRTVHWHSRRVATTLLRRMIAKLKPKKNEHERRLYCTLMQSLHGLKFTTPKDTCVTLSAVAQGVGVFLFPFYGVYGLYSEIASVPGAPVGKHWYAELLKLKQLPFTAIDSKEAFDEVMEGVDRYSNVLFRIGCIDLLEHIALNAKYAHHDVTAELATEKLEEWEKPVGRCGKCWTTDNYLVQYRLRQALKEIRSFKLKGVVRAVQSMIRMSVMGGLSSFKLNDGKMKSLMNGVAAMKSAGNDGGATRRERVNKELLEKETKLREEERDARDKAVAEAREKPNELWDRAVAAEEAGDLDAAAPLYKELADSDAGHFDAENKVGFLYEKGLGGMQQSFEYACQYYRRAAIQGVPEAQYNLGVCYSRGRGTEQDYVRARTWFHYAADGNERRALHNLGVIYFNGMGMPRVDLERAKQCFEKAAELGYSASEASLEMVVTALAERDAKASGGIPGQVGAEGEEKAQLPLDERPMSDEEILREWEEERRMAANESAFIDHILSSRSTARDMRNSARTLETLHEHSEHEDLLFDGTAAGSDPETNVADATAVDSEVLSNIEDEEELEEVGELEVVSDVELD